jgi:hypothetical protein
VDSKLLEYILAGADPWATSSHTTRESAFLPLIKSSWAFLQYPDFCCVLQGLFSSKGLARFGKSCEKWTVGAHLLPVSIERKTGLNSFCSLKKLLGLDWPSTSVPQNGLPLCKELEEALDRQDLCFVYVPQRHSWVVRVVNPMLRGTVTLTDRWTREITPFQPPGLTWERIDGTGVRMAPVVSRRVLLYHAHRAADKHGVSLELQADSVRADSEVWVRKFLQGLVLPPLGPDPDLEPPQQ